ncbi:glycosyltransferase family 39 protein [Variovorax sp. PAMC28562]|uniref:ArnT family glycosyltransferase n=1 Tax=Variovorax sp. PAMC28562 TaxID=2762323 RepID=UPI00164E98B4|nr:glycosyltransferase family 39 protein [Variovorax sp. PAMC28562]QNK71892.1 glycosyltransferase family 39 protein [Variovorax sp. PAMC28562]
MKSLRNSIRQSNRRSTFISIAIIFLWLAATAGFRRFTAPDEGRYAGVALEMIRSGDWLVPRLDGLPFFHKPPLFYWIGAASMSVFGVSEWPARLPSVLGATLAASALLMFARRWADGVSASVATVVLLTMPFFYVGAQFANLDMLVAGCIAATVLAAAHAALAKEHGGAWRRALALAFATAALGVLAKGLIGFVLPGAIFLAWCLVTGRFRAAWMLAWWPGWCIFLAMAAPWFVAMQVRYPAFYDYFVVTQHFRRFAAAGFNNAHPFWFYGPVIVGLTLPWIGWIGWQAVARRHSGHTSAATTASAAFSDVDWLMLVWFIVIVVFFSLPKSKLIGYVLPALPPLAWFIARALRATTPTRWMTSPKLQWTTGVAAVICVASVIVADRLGTPPGARLYLPAEERIAADDQVVMLDAYYYEIPFYWKLKHTVMVVSDWQDPALPLHDNWRNELSDAGRFEPARAATTLVNREDLPRVLCMPKRTWIVGSSASFLTSPWLLDQRFVPVAHNQEAAIWRFDGPQRPSAGCVAFGKPARPSTGDAS